MYGVPVLWYDTVLQSVDGRLNAHVNVFTEAAEATSVVPEPIQ